ncbi:MAG: AraC family ligand binding domain-containing protein, partial [Eubacteriales bacterium]|nr:AraC family ligand binding domain-containing protein [Eubacteriales bacterium]
MEDAYVLSFENKEHHFQELHLNFCGHSTCHPGHHIGPAAHPCYVLHYILEGKGWYQIDTRTYSLEKNQGFLMEPDVVSSYEADTMEPWRYLWIGFEGSYAKELLQQIGLGHHTLTFDANCGEQLLSFVDNILNCELSGIEQELYLQAQLFHFLSCLSHHFSVNPNVFQRNKQNYYVRAAEAFIRENYAEDIKIQDIADAAGISRSYLTILFQNILHV